MGLIESAEKTYNKFMGGAGSLSETIGVSAAKAALHMAFPNDFEYYMMAFELVDSMDRTIDYFVFPVMPENFTQIESSITTIRKTMGGVAAVGNSTFVPINITISGNFGRKFTIMTSKPNVPEAAVAHYSTVSGTYNKEGFIRKLHGKFKKIIMNSRVKTGYGAIKILESICDKSKGDIDGIPVRLYLYNPAFNCNYLVKVINAKFSQSMSTNMIWSYEIQLTAIAPLEVVVGTAAMRASMKVALASDIVSKGASKLAQSLYKVSIKAGQASVNKLIDAAREKELKEISSVSRRRSNTNTV